MTVIANGRHATAITWPRLLGTAMVLMLILWLTVDVTQARTLRIIALGDSLTAGYGLEESQSFPAQLQAELRRRGEDVEIVNAGVSGDTTSGGLARLDWAIPADADAVIVELGANDALRGIETAVIRQSLEQIVIRLRARGLPVLLAGIDALPSLGDEYRERFRAIYTDLVDEYGLLYYPFFLKGVVLNPELNLSDGMHPNAQGIAVIVDNIAAKVEQLIERARQDALDQEASR